ncbi:MAG TPA: SBBP repeat-containing protein [Actinomycetota bacterium]|nr:SBBP repeat-containing protein [Actinomycetota bacterium]
MKWSRRLVAVAAITVALAAPGARGAAPLGRAQPAPTQLVYSTYLGGEDAEEMGSEVEVDAAGNAYLTGSTASRDYPFTDVAPENRRRDWPVAPVTKVDPSGAIVYSTFVEGSVFAQGLAVDDAGYAYVTGYAYEDLVTTPGVAGETYGGEDDAFVAKLDPDGRLVWATYLGGQLPDGGTDVEVDAAGNVYVTGYTFSKAFPVTDGAYETDRPGGYDAFVTKLSPDGSQLVFSTYLGGRDGERGVELTGDPTLDVDGSGAVYVTGVTFSKDFPTTHQELGYPRRANAFVSKLSPDGSDLVFSTVLGGRGVDGASDVEVDASGRVYLVGNTRSVDFPVTAGAFDTSIGKQDRTDEDGFVVRLGPNGESIEYATFLGGEDGDELSALEPLEDGSVYVTGSGSIGYPVTDDAFDPGPVFSDRSSRWARLDPFGDTVVTHLDATGSELVYSTHLGGTSYELARDVEIDGEHVVVAGYAESANFPTTPDALRMSADEPGSHNMFLSRLLPGGDEPCTNHGHDGDDFLDGTPANDLLCGFGGADEIDGLGGNDVVYGGDGADGLIGGAGYDVLLGGKGDDVLLGRAGPDSLFGEAGRDGLDAGGGKDRRFVAGIEDQLVDGGPGNDSLFGGRFFDLLVGRAGKDVLYGRGGPDVLRAGAGNDRLLAGNGRDRCVDGQGRDERRSCEE